MNLRPNLYRWKTTTNTLKRFAQDFGLMCEKY